MHGAGKERACPPAGSEGGLGEILMGRRVGKARTLSILCIDFWFPGHFNQIRSHFSVCCFIHNGPFFSSGNW